MAKQAVAAHSVDLEPIDRLEEKITRLVSMVAQLRAEQAKSVDDNARLTQELDSLRARLADADAANTELLALARRARHHPLAGLRDAAAARGHLDVFRGSSSWPRRMSSVVTVEIAGQRYPIRSSLDERYVAELAAYVDQKMRAASMSAPASDMLGLAVLVALNIADEYFRARQQQSSATRRYQRARHATGTSRGRCPRPGDREKGCRSP